MNLTLLVNPRAGIERGADPQTGNSFPSLVKMHLGSLLPALSDASQAKTQLVPPGPSSAFIRI